MNENKELGMDLRQSAVIMIILVAVNVIEYWFSQTVKSQIVLTAAMFLLAFIDSGLIMVYYMHILRLWEPEEGESH
jgi:heme/copper-type cytochrome/quinol oxidase subunit 4